MSSRAAPANKVTDDYCYPCHYFSYDTKTCDYYLMTKRRRGCPGGEGCERRKPRVVYERRNFNGRGVDDGERKFVRTLNSVMRDLYEEGLSDKAIGDRLGVSELSVSLWRRRSGLPSQTALRKECEQDWI